MKTSTTGKCSGWGSIHRILISRLACEYHAAAATGEKRRVLVVVVVVGRYTIKCRTAP